MRGGNDPGLEEIVQDIVSLGSLSWQTALETFPRRLLGQTLDQFYPKIVVLFPWVKSLLGVYGVTQSPDLRYKFVE